MNKLTIAIAFIAGTLFMYSLIGEYARYGMAIDSQVKECEESSKECNYVISPVISITPDNPDNVG